MRAVRAEGDAADKSHSFVALVGCGRSTRSAFQRGVFLAVWFSALPDPREIKRAQNKSRQINRRDVSCLDGFRRLGVLWFIHDFSCRRPAVSALLR
jgi:hypothetical protein